MSAPSEIIGQLLTDSGIIDQSADWPGYISFMPGQPDNAVAIYDMPGEDDGRIMSGEKIDHPGVQVMVRSKVFATGWDKAEEIATALDNQSRTTVAIESSPIYILHNASRKGTINHMGLKEDDGQRRHYFSINMTVTIAETA